MTNQKKNETLVNKVSKTEYEDKFSSKALLDCFIRDSFNKKEA